MVSHTVELRGFVARLPQQVDTLKQRAHLVWSKNNLLAAKCQQGIFARGLFRRGCREQQPGFGHQLHGAYPADKSLMPGSQQLHIQHDELRDSARSAIAAHLPPGGDYCQRTDLWVRLGKKMYAAAIQMGLHRKQCSDRCK